MTEVRPLWLPWRAGVAYYNCFLRSVSLKKVFFWSAMVLIAVHIAQVVLVTGQPSFSSFTVALPFHGGKGTCFNGAAMAGVCSPYHVVAHPQMRQ